MENNHNSRRIVYQRPNKFRVSFPHDQDLIDRVNLIPGRENDNQDAVWIIPATSARHLFALAVWFKFEYPPELKEAAELFADEDELEVLPRTKNYIDKTGDSLVIRTAERYGTFGEGEILRRIVKTGSRLGLGYRGWGWNPERKYWELPLELVDVHLEDLQKLHIKYGYGVRVELLDRVLEGAYV